MRASVAFLAAAVALVKASPFPQGVTSQVSPTASAPSGCSTDHPGYFGIAVSKVGGSRSSKLQQVIDRRDAMPQVVTSIKDGQLQAPTSTSSLSMTTPSSSTLTGKTSNSAASKTSTATKATGTTTGTGSGSTKTATGASSISYSSTTTITLTDTVTIDCATTVCITTSTVNSNSEKTASTLSTSTTTKLSNTQTSSTGTSTTMIPVSQISDGQVQATNTTPDPSTARSSTFVNPVTTISDGQIQAPTGSSKVVARDVFEVSDEGSFGFFADADALAAHPTPVACETNKTLSMQLRHGVLTDHHGRTGYIASNYQFQFDAPAQSGAIYTAGWSLCSNGSLALGGSTVFYQCLSGSFYNLYDRYWAPQCKAIELVMVKLLDC